MTASTDNVDAELAALQQQNAYLEESLADAELAAEDRGWQLLGAQAQEAFSRQGLRQIAENCRVYSVVNPLVKRGLALRAAYVWGQGVTVAARAVGEDGQQDVNAVVQAFLDDESNRASVSSAQAQQQLEHTLGTDGNVFLACFTDSKTGRVQVRTIDPGEVDYVYTNPEDSGEPWYYLRKWQAVQQESASGGVRTVPVERSAYYPALTYKPAQRPRSIDGTEVVWTAPVLHVKVNGLPNWDFGIGDAYSSLAWCRAYQEFMTDWAKLMKALSRFAWRLSSDKRTKASKAAHKIAEISAQDATGDSNSGATAAMGPGTNLEAMPKSGATLDANSGRPLAALAAAGFGLPVTMLLADPGQTGARAVAETLDTPTELEMKARRNLWSDVLRQLLDYVVDASVRAPQGALKGTLGRGILGQQTVVLAGDTPRTLDIQWPDLTSTPVEVLVKAIVEADSTGYVPNDVVLRLLLTALGVEDVDEVLDAATDDDGNLQPSAEAVGDAATRAFRRGEARLRG